MNSKKGFTLVELLGVLVVLGLISVIIVPKVIDSITTSKEAAYQTQVETIENAAKKYGISNDLLYPKEGEKKYIAVKDLIAVGELSDKEIINPKTGNKMNGYVLVEYNSGYQQYEYTYVEEIDENALGAMGPIYEVKDPDKWTTSKNVTIIYPKGNGKYDYDYKILAGTVDINGQEYKGETGWIAATELRKNITFKTNGSLIARVKNKDEYINGSILEIEKIDNTAPSVALGYDKNTLTTNKIDLVATCTDDESGISKYLFKLGNGNWIDNGTSNKYTFSNLNNTTSYNFSVECINGVGMTNQSTLPIKLNDIDKDKDNIWFEVSDPSIWKTNKNVKIFYPANYTRYEFSIIDGTATRNGQELTPGTWYIASSLQETVNFTTEGTIAARIYDGTNLSSIANQAITYVDPTKPTCEILLTGGTLGTNGYYTVAPKVQFKTSIAGGSGIYFGQSKTNSPVYDNSVTKNNSGLINITSFSEGNNAYYGFVKTGAGNTSTCTASFKADTFKPVVAINGNASVSYANSSATITVPLKITDLTSGIDTNTFTDSDITVKVGTTTVTPTKSLKYNSVSNGVYSYTLTLSGVTGNGALNLSVGAGMVVDKAGNKNNTASISTNVIIDNTAPTLEITGTNGTTYKKESDATITLKDTGGSGLTAGSYTIKYGWATSSQTCSNLTSSTTITVAAGATSGSVKVNVKGKTGAGKLYVCNSTSITDRAKNTLSANSIVSSNMYLDNEGPILSDITKSIKQLDSSEYKSAGLDDWTNGYTKLEWNVTEGNSGINRIEYRLNNQTTWSTGGGFTITKNGSTTKYVMERNAQRNDVIYIRVVDNMGNVSEVKSSTLKIDTKKPTWNSGITKYNKNTSSAAYTLAGSDDWSLYATKLEWSFNESISGINRIEYRINDATTWMPGGGFTTSQDGNIYKYVMERTDKRDNLLHLRAVDNAGNVSEEKSIRLRIASSATIPTDSLCVPRTYNGSNQQITSVTSGTGYTLKGYDQTDAGTHTITATLASGYRWSDNTTGTKTFKCSISKATPTITLSAPNGSVVKGKTLTFTEEANVAGKFTNASGTTSVATVSPESIANVSANTAKTVTVTGVTNGSSTITVNFVPTDTKNYNNAVAKTYTATILNSATIPTDSLCVSRTYNGNKQNITSVTSGTGYTLKGYDQTDAGTHTITATLASGYRWSDNTTGTKTFKCSINKATPTIKFATTSGSVTYHTGNGFGGNWIYSPVKVSGTVTLTSSNTNYVSIQENYVSTKVDSSTSQPAPNFTIVVNGVKATSTPIPITVKFTPDNENFETVTETYNVTVNKATPTITLSEESAWLSGSKTFTEKANVAGKFTNTSGTTSVATVSPKSNSTAVAANTAQTVTVTGVKDGSSTITVNFEPTDTTNYRTVSAKYTAKVDKTRPTITANGYAYSKKTTDKTSTKYNDTGPMIKGHRSNDATSSDTYDWNNTGINFRINFSDSGSGIESAKWCWNDGGDYTTNTETKNCSTNVINYKQIELVGAGYRKGRFTVTDKAGNTTVYNVIVKIDKTRPTITVDGYKYSNKSGTSTSTPYNETGSKIIGHSSNDATSSDTYDWNKPGINFRISFSDSNAGIKSAKWCWDTKHSTTDPGTTVFNSKSNSSCSDDIRDYKQVSLTGEGYRRGRFTVEDNAGNTTVYDVVVKIDRTGPSIKINFVSEGENTNWSAKSQWLFGWNPSDSGSGVSSTIPVMSDLNKISLKIGGKNYNTYNNTSSGNTNSAAIFGYDCPTNTTCKNFYNDNSNWSFKLNELGKMYFLMYRPNKANPQYPTGKINVVIPAGLFTDKLGNKNVLSTIVGATLK